jgi:hypothetical protein
MEGEGEEEGRIEVSPNPEGLGHPMKKKGKARTSAAHEEKSCRQRIPDSGDVNRRVGPPFFVRTFGKCAQPTQEKNCRNLRGFDLQEFKKKTHPKGWATRDSLEYKPTILPMSEFTTKQWGARN